ncbi:hypothetical protein L6164_019237 [Bauhinia variegata]|uniref:Uncharacterized protein n=1 Tax=Bauhinia variegata TaxID=167791 RepID=A0ACB9NEL5_BAUVA|nr:hypothetical protein L6164_019237 [Bauhinia variegata]
MSGGFFRGTSADQDTRFSNKQAKLLKSQKFAPELDHLVDMTKVNMEVIKPWITRRVTELLGFEDEVLINFIHSLLDVKAVNGKEVQIQITGFMEKNTGKFMKELWTLLLSAQKNASGVPQQFLDAKEEELRKKKIENDRITSEIQKKKDKESREIMQQRMKKMDGEFDAKDPDTASDRALKSRDSGDYIQEGKDTDKRNGVRARNRVSKSPHSPAVSTSPHQSMSKSFSNSQSYSGDRHRPRSISRSPEARGRSHSSERIRCPSRRRSISPPRRRSPRQSPSPRRRPSYLRRRSRSRSHYKSPSPIRRRVHSPFRHRSPSPLRRRRSPSSLRRRRSPSPLRRRRSPSLLHRRKSPSPLRRRRSPSPLRRRRSPSPLHRRRSPSPIRRHRSPSPLRRRRSPSPIRQSSPSLARRRSPITRRRSPSLGRHRSPVPASQVSPLPPQHRSSSPLDSPSPARRKYRIRTPRHTSPSPLPHRAPINKRLSSLSPHRSSTPSERSSQSPIQHAYPSQGGRKMSRHERSPVLSSWGKVRMQERSSLEAHQPFSPLRILQRDKHRTSSRHKSEDSFSTPEKSPIVSAAPRARNSSSSEDRRSFSPYGSPGRQRGVKVIHEKDLSSMQKPIHDSSGTSDGAEEIFGRENRDHKLKSSQNESKYSSPISKRNDLPAKYHRKDELSPKRAAGHLSSERQGRCDKIGLRKKGREAKSEKSPGRGIHPETLAQQKSPIYSERPREPYAVDSKKSDEDNRTYLNQVKDVKDDDRQGKLEVAQDSVRKFDHVNPSVSNDSGSEKSDKHRREDKDRRKYKRSDRKVVSSDENYSYDSELEKRKESKKRKKEERKLRKEEKRKRREERRRKKEERRAEKLKRKGKADDNEAERLGSQGSDDEEIELRNKALESLNAKKRMNTK